LFDTVENVCKQNRWWDRFPTHVRYIFTTSFSVKNFCKEKSENKHQ
jgi:hypothetical protein